MYLAGILANIGSLAGSTSPIRYLSATWPGAGFSAGLAGGLTAGLSTGAEAGAAGGASSGAGAAAGSWAEVATAGVSVGAEGGASALTSVPLIAMSTEELAVPGPLQAARTRPPATTRRRIINFSSVRAPRPTDSGFGLPNHGGAAYSTPCRRVMSVLEPCVSS